MPSPEKEASSFIGGGSEEEASSFVGGVGVLVHRSSKRRPCCRRWVKKLANEAVGAAGKVATMPDGARKIYAGTSPLENVANSCWSRG